MGSMDKKKLLYTILILVIFIFLIYIRSYKQFENFCEFPATDEVVSMINHHHSSITTRDLEWIYFSDIKSGSLLNSQGTLYRMKNDGSEIQKILDVAARNLIIDRDFLYYLDSSNHSKLYALSLNDFSTNLVSSKIISEFIIVGEWIYFCEKAEEEYVYQMSRMRLDGSSYKALISNSKMAKSLNCSDIMYKDGYIYFSSTDNRFSIYRMSIENEKVELLLKDKGRIYSIFDNNILISNQEAFKLYNLDTNIFKEAINTNLGEYKVDLINIYNGICYAIGYKKDNISNRELLKITKKGYEVVYNEFIVEYFNIQGDWLFFLASDNPDNIHELSLYRLNLINSEIIKINSG